MSDKQERMSDLDFGRYESPSANSLTLKELQNAYWAVVAECRRAREVEVEMKGQIVTLEQEIALEIQVRNDHIAVLEKERNEVLQIIRELRQKLAIAGVEGSPPHGEDTTIGFLQLRIRKAEKERDEALALFDEQECSNAVASLRTHKKLNEELNQEIIELREQLKEVDFKYKSALDTAETWGLVQAARLDKLTTIRDAWLKWLTHFDPCSECINTNLFCPEWYRLLKIAEEATEGA